MLILALKGLKLNPLCQDHLASIPVRFASPSQGYMYMQDRLVLACVVDVV